MRVTFDSNTWERIVVPHRYPNDPFHADLLTINAALRDGKVQGFISETVATLEAIPRPQRASYFLGRILNFDPVYERSSGNTIQASVQLGADDSYHPDLKPVLTDRLQAARDLGFKLLPSSRFGIPRPAEVREEEFRIPLTAWQEEKIMDHLQRISDVCDSIEARGVGRAILERLGERMQARLGIAPAEFWLDGIDRPANENEAREVIKAFSEWADGDSIALHVAYGIDLFCTGDEGKSAGVSVLDSGNREWLTQTYEVRFVSIPELARML